MFLYDILYDNNKQSNKKPWPWIKYIIIRYTSPSDFQSCSYLSWHWTVYYLHNRQAIRPASWRATVRKSVNDVAELKDYIVHVIFRIIRIWHSSITIRMHVINDTLKRSLPPICEEPMESREINKLSEATHNLSTRITNSPRLWFMFIRTTLTAPFANNIVRINMDPCRGKFVCNACGKIIKNLRIVVYFYYNLNRVFDLPRR